MEALNMGFRLWINALGGFVFVLMVAFPCLLKAEEERVVYSLDQSIREAIANSPSIRAKKERIDQKIYVEKQARAEFLPKLSTTYGYRRLNERTTRFAGQDIPVSQDNYEWRGIITQPVFKGFALIGNYNLAKLGIDQSEMELDLEKLDLAFRVKEAYYNVLIADVAIEVAQKDVEARESNKDVATSFYEVGMIPVNELLRAEVELANSKQNLVSVQNAARLARAAFNTVLSRPVSEPVNLELVPDIKPEVGDFEEYVKEAFENRPEIKLIDINLLQVDEELRLTKSENLPEVTFTYEYIKEGDDPNVSGSDFHDANRWQAMAVASWTFWEWGKTYYSTREKESLKKELFETRSLLEDDIRLEVKRATLELETAEKNIPTTKKAIEQGEENLRVNEERYKAQVTTITEVLDAQSLLTRARVDYYRAIYNHYLAKAKLHRALGTY
jgi:outer membrane protein TolC